MAYSHPFLSLSLILALFEEAKAPMLLEKADVKAGVVGSLEVMFAVGIIGAPALPEILEWGPAANGTVSGGG